MDKGLIFRWCCIPHCSAELAGRMGLMFRIWVRNATGLNKGQISTAILKQPTRPNIANSIAGEQRVLNTLFLKLITIDIQKLWNWFG
jgi:hypothetical protein